VKQRCVAVCDANSGFTVSTDEDKFTCPATTVTNRDYIPKDVQGRLCLGLKPFMQLINLLSLTHTSAVLPVALCASRHEQRTQNVGAEYSELRDE
jgi:hypothetical protein